MRGFYIGRFQPYHGGHHEMVGQIARDVDELVVGIGTADQSHTTPNPFTAGERVMMVTKALVEYDLVTYVVPIEDLNRHSVWVSHVQSMSPRFDVAFSNNPLVIRLFEEAGIEVRSSEMFHREEYEGAEIRERMMNDEGWEDLVPDVVVEVMDEIDGVERLRQISNSDTDGARTDGAGPDEAGLDVVGLDAVALDGVEPDQAEPDQAEPDQAEPDQAEPDQAEPDQAGLEDGPYDPI